MYFKLFIVNNFKINQPIMIFKLKDYAKMQLKNNGLANFTDLNTLSKLLIGMTKTDISNIPIFSRLTTIVNILNASITNQVSLTSNQVDIK